MIYVISNRTSTGQECKFMSFLSGKDFFTDKSFLNLVKLILNLNNNCIFLIDLAPNVIPFSAKSIGKVYYNPYLD